MLCASGTYTSVHLAQLHYKKPQNQLTLINTFPALERFMDRKQLEKTVDSSSIDSLDLDNPLGTPGFDPYANVMNEGHSKTAETEAKESCDLSEAVSCTAVDNSKYSELFGIGVSIYGVAGYFLLLILCVISLARKKKYSGFIDFMIFGGGLGGVLFSAWLTWLEAYVIKSYCPYCVVSAALMSLSFIIILIGYGIEPLTFFRRRTEE